jgi:hypothetical protein
MGHEISAEHFRQRDYQRFDALLRAETEQLAHWLEAGALSARRDIGGLELEAWLIAADGRPLALNEAYLAALDSPMVVPELSRFNVEINVAPQALAGAGLAALGAELAATWARAQEVATCFGAQLAAIGILPTVTEAELGAGSMSATRRFKALNEQVMRARQGRPIRLDIRGLEHLATVHQDVMLEAATTSFQIHLQVPAENAARYYNAAQIVSAPMVAVAANAPFLFGHALWHETRVPLFEQAVPLDSRDGLGRVSFGSGYAGYSLLECFRENIDAFPVLLPEAIEDARRDADRMHHLRLHNGTIWRWNRPLLGFDEDDAPHFRIEHRVMPAGPTLTDMMANLALYFGLVESLASMEMPPESRMPFAVARSNFYACARAGLHAEVTWLDGDAVAVRELLARELLPLAARGLERLGVNGVDVARLLGVIEARLSAGRNGAIWQLAFAERHGRDMGALTHAYQERSLSDAPVHTWNF